MATETWGFDIAHSSVKFSVRHLMVSKVHGRFAQWEGNLLFDEAKPSRSRVSVRIDASSIETKEKDRDAHLWPGSGSIDWEQAIELLQSSPHRPPLLLEIEGDEKTSVSEKMSETFTKLEKN